MANEQNLKTPTSKEARERGKKGGIASGKARREKKALKDTLELLLSMPMKDGAGVDVEAVKSFASLKGENINVQEAMTIAMLQRAMKGDVRAAEWIRDTIGQKPTDNMNMSFELPVFFKGEDELEE